MIIKNNGCLTPEQCEEINKSNELLNLDVHIKSEDTKSNPGMKGLSKLCLNNLWGKFGQRASLDNYELINNHNKFIRRITDDKINTKAIHIINSNCVELRYTHDTDYDIEA